MLNERSICGYQAAEYFKTLQLQQPLAQLLPAFKMSVSLSFSLILSLALSTVGRLAADAHLILGGIHRNLPVAIQHAGSTIVLHMTRVSRITPDHTMSERPWP